MMDICFVNAMLDAVSLVHVVAVKYKVFRFNSN